MKALGACLTIAIGLWPAAATQPRRPPNDFVPGARLVFQDDFKAVEIGAVPAKWKLLAGHAAVSELNGERVLALQEGRDVKFAPKLGADLGDAFTVELDVYPPEGSFGGVIVYLAAGDDERQLAFGQLVLTNGLEHELSGWYPVEAGTFTDRWHHIALSVRDGKVKCYEDRYLILTVPDLSGFKPRSVSFGGGGNPDMPVVIKNVKIAVG